MEKSKGRRDASKEIRTRSSTHSDRSPINRGGKEPIVVSGALHRFIQGSGRFSEREEQRQQAAEQI